MCSYTLPFTSVHHLFKILDYLGSESSGIFLWLKVVDFLSGIHSWPDYIFTFQEISLHLWYENIKYFWAAGHWRHTTGLLSHRTQPEFQSAKLTLDKSHLCIVFPATIRSGLGRASAYFQLVVWLETFYWSSSLSENPQFSK